MKKRNILMCLEHLDIGGIETAVVTLCKGYKRAGHKVYVAAPNGLYLEELEKNDIEVFKIEYIIDNHFHLEVQEELINFCKEKEISEVHIHQYPCAMYWLPVLMKLHIPYVFYGHSIVPGAIEWFTREFPLYKIAIPMLLENASKIVCIAESTKQEIEDIYKLGEDRYLIIPNSLNMDDFPTGKVPNQIKTFGIASRLSEEKVDSIKNAIDLFTRYLEIEPSSRLLIAGAGPEKKQLERYAKSKDLTSKIDFLGSVTNMPEFYQKIDVFMGVDRCVLEAIACKRLTIISSYTGTMNIVDNSNIEQASNQNFSGMNLDNDEKIFECLKNITEKEYKKIVNENYKYIDKKYNVDNNLYNDKLACDYSKDYKYIFSTINSYSDEIYRINSKWPIKTYRAIINFIRRVTRKIKSLFIK